MRSSSTNWLLTIALAAVFGGCAEGDPVAEQTGESFYCNTNGHCEPELGENFLFCAYDCPITCQKWQDQCSEHQRIPSYCAPEVAAVNAVDSYCGNVRWDGWCVREVSSIANRNTCGGWPGQQGWGDSVYFLSGPRPRGRGDAIDYVCLIMPSCCDNANGNWWSPACLDLISHLPGGWASPNVGSTACGNKTCDAGETPTTCGFDCGGPNGGPLL